MPIPFYSAYRDAQKASQAREMGDLQQAIGTQGLLASIAQQQRATQEVTRNEALRTAIAALPPEKRTRENVLPLLLQYGNVKEAVPLIKGMGDEKPSSIGSGGLRLADGTIVPPAARPASTPASPQLIQIIAARDALPAGHPNRKILDQAIEKLSTHQAPVNVYSGSLTAGVDEDDNPVFVQPSGRPGVNPRVVPNVRPPLKTPPEKAIPVPLQKQLTESAELADATQRFVSGFKDEFGGKTITGGAGNVYGRIMGDDTGQAQWWQDYELHQSQVRNKLFGSALTAPEIEAWNKSAINPRMNSGEIRKNLARRAELEQSGLARLMKGIAAGGYNKAQIEAFTGRSFDGEAPPPPPAAPVPAAGGWTTEKERRFQELKRKQGGGT